MPKTLDITFTSDRLRELLDYDRETGLFVRRQRPELNGRGGASNTRNAGKPTGSLTSNGYILISIDYKRYLAHRLAWVIEHGSIKETDEIDHINGIRTDNRIINLRTASRVTNSQNVSVNRKSATNLVGVSQAVSGRWVARASPNKYLGTYDSKEQATRIARDYRRNNYAGWTGRES